MPRCAAVSSGGAPAAQRSVRHSASIAVRRSVRRMPAAASRFTGSGVPSPARAQRSRTSIGRSPAAASASNAARCCRETRLAAASAASQPSARSTKVRVTVPVPRFTAPGVIDASVMPTGHT